MKKKGGMRFNLPTPLIPGLSFFSKLQPCHSFYFIDPKLHAKFQKKLMSSKDGGKDGGKDGETKRVITKDPVW